MTYLLRSGHRHRDGYDIVHVGDEFTAQFPEINRDTGRTIGGMFRVVEGSGKYDRRHVSMWLSKINHSVSVPVTSDGIKSALREMRPDDRDRLADIDTEMGDLQARLDALRTERGRLLHEAFKRGDRVLPPEVIRAADARLAYFEQRREERAREESP